MLNLKGLLARITQQPEVNNQTFDYINHPQSNPQNSSCTTNRDKNKESSCLENNRNKYDNTNNVKMEQNLNVKTKEEEQYFVERITNKKLIHGEVYYLVKWEGYPESESTWEPRKNLEQSISLVDEFESKRQKKGKSSGISSGDQSAEEARQKKLNKKKVTKKEDKKKDTEEIPKPTRILGCRASKNGKGGLEYALEWEIEGHKPFRACCPTEKLAEHWPKLLIDYLEKNICLPEDV